MKEKIDQFYLVRQDMLTEAMQKTLEVKSILESGKTEKVAKAVQMAGLSRSAYYKYKDAVYPFHTVVKEQIITLSIQLKDKSGALSELLTAVASTNTNILTINQSIPLEGRANVTLTLDISSSLVKLQELIYTIQTMETVERAEMVGSGSL
ncbi:ACT domain-containing protein [Alteribacillus iranensis]|uniref:UPF0735 ACT domain-containing protein SAMN05192532_10147 n=1 Tax=Alteribacillus iranensis TaxID=930128 RepID=A0A1I1Z585_9BACI|nr:ACT domain-containing protein [Alteribacillus iranensis]SFE26925.1 chorismate mutase [Alteribacillus iranensis]